ncbi:MAG: hydrogenase iron-sulfur subunit [Candidatus Thorarchaeota archaeon]
MVIVTFLCENCGQGAANTAGVQRMPYDSRINIVRVPCAGRVGPRQIMQAINGGAEAVSIIGCCFGACHFNDANMITLRSVKILKKFMVELGYSANCITMYTARAAEGDTVVGDFDEIIELSTDTETDVCLEGHER